MNTEEFKILGEKVDMQGQMLAQHNTTLAVMERDIKSVVRMLEDIKRRNEEEKKERSDAFDKHEEEAKNIYATKAEINNRVKPLEEVHKTFRSIAVWITGLTICGFIGLVIFIVTVLRDYIPNI